MRNNRLLGILLVACSLLATEVVLTRVFSVVMLYHFAFLAISVSLFGLGAGGIVLHLVGRRAEGREGSLLAWAGIALGLSEGLAVIVLLSMRLDDLLSVKGMMNLAVVYLVTALPFLCGGFFVSLMLKAGHKQAGKVYFFDLVGAALGCLLTIPLLKIFGGPAAVLVAGALGVLGGMISADSFRPSRFAAGLLTIVLLLGAVGLHWQTGHRLLEPRWIKGRERVVYDEVAWNSFSRVLAFARSKEQTGLPFDDVMIEIDGVAHTPITPFDGKNTAITQVPTANIQRLPYILRPRATTLIFGSGGGEHILTALDCGARRIVGVEFNPIVVRLVNERFADVSGGLFHYHGQRTLPELGEVEQEVEVVVDEGRSFIRRTDQKFDVIQFTLVDTWTATAAGAFTLSENNVFTLEAMHEYLDHLKPGGVISIKRWLDTEEVVLRLMALAKTALIQRGVEHPQDHFFVAYSVDQKDPTKKVYANLMIRAEPFDIHDPAINELDEQCAKMGLGILYSPFHAGDGERFIELAKTGDMAAWFAAQETDLTPPTDNRPFLFYTLKPTDLPRVFQESMAYDTRRDNLGPVILFALLGMVGLFVLALILLPAWLIRDQEAKAPLRWPLYFAALGLAYLLVEVAIMSKFILFLGHPTYALAVVLFTLLLSSGLGAALSERIYPDKARARLKLVVVCLAAYAAVFMVVSPLLFQQTLAFALSGRIVISVLPLLPLGLLMGMPFPLGIRLLGFSYPRSIPWLYAVNSAASVMGSVAAMLLAVHFGFSSAVELGLALYVAAGFLL